MRNALENYAASERRSLSSSIENILLDHLKSKYIFVDDLVERRKHTRKPVNISAQVSLSNKGKKKSKQDIEFGVILDISMGGIKITVPNDVKIEIVENKPQSTFDLHFVLPDEKTPVNFTCNPCMVKNAEKETHIGAYFVDADFNSLQKLHNYLN
jgi:c-di-GMP-binding flagellar brake protein YcgR